MTRKVNPKTAEEAVALLTQTNDVQVVGGGTSVIYDQFLGKLRPPALLVGVDRIEEITRLDAARGWIGAGVRLDVARQAEGWPDLLRVAVDLHRVRGGTPVVRRATIGGRLLADGGSSSLAAVLVALDGEAELITPEGRERVPLEKILGWPRKPALPRHCILLGVQIRAPRAEAGQQLGADYREEITDGAPKGAAVAVLTVEGDRIRTANVAVGGNHPGAVRARQVESTLVGRAGDEAVFALAGQTAREEIDPADDNVASRDERLDAVERLTREAVAAAFAATQE